MPAATYDAQGAELARNQKWQQIALYAAVAISERLTRILNEIQALGHEDVNHLAVQAIQEILPELSILQILKPVLTENTADVDQY